MGATQSATNHNSIALKTENKQIILHYSYKTMLKISQATTFPHGYEGLKTWDANIVMARFVLINLNKFKNKSIIEMCSGTGLVGVTLGKYTSLKKLTLTDLTDEVVGLIKNNCLKNEVDEKKFIAFRLLWDQYIKFVAKYDVICASDPFFHRCSPQLLTAVANHYLEPGGVLYLSSPKSEQLQRFLKMAQQTKFEVRKQKLNSYQYLSSPLLNQVDGQKQFPAVCAGDIDIYEIIKRPPIRGYHEEYDVNVIHKKQLDRIRQQKNHTYITPKKQKSLEQIQEGVEEEQVIIEHKKQQNQQVLHKQQQKVDKCEQQKQINQTQTLTIAQLSDQKPQNKQQMQRQILHKVDDMSKVKVQQHEQTQKTIDAQQQISKASTNHPAQNQVSLQTTKPQQQVQHFTNQNQSQETQNNETLEKNSNDEPINVLQYIKSQTEQKGIEVDSESKQNNLKDESAIKQQVEVEADLNKNEIVEQKVTSETKQEQKQKEKLQSQTQARSQIDAVSGKVQAQVSTEIEKLNQQTCVNNDKQVDASKVDSLNEQKSETFSQTVTENKSQTTEEQNEIISQAKQQQKQVKKKKKKNKKN